MHSVDAVEVSEPFGGCLPLLICIEKAGYKSGERSTGQRVCQDHTNIDADMSVGVLEEVCLDLTKHARSDEYANRMPRTRGRETAA